MNGNSLAPLFGAALVVGFVLIIVLAVMSDKKANRKFKEMIDNDYKIKDKEGNISLTQNNEIMIYCGSGTLAGYKVWPIEDISYVGISTIPASRLCFCFMDENKKAMNGKYLTPSKKPLMQYKQSTFPASNREELDQVFAFVQKHKSDVMKCKNGIVSE